MQMLIILTPEHQHHLHTVHPIILILVLLLLVTILILVLRLLVTILILVRHLLVTILIHVLRLLGTILILEHHLLVTIQTLVRLPVEIRTCNHLVPLLPMEIMGRGHSHSHNMEEVALTVFLQERILTKKVLRYLVKVIKLLR